MFLSPLYLLLFHIQNSLSGEVLSCEINNYCDNEHTIACSVYGNCGYDVYKYYNATPSRELSCLCHKGYTTYKGILGENEEIGKKVVKYCCYKQKSQFTAFLLEFLVGFGAGHYYLGKYKHAATKTLIQIGLCVFCFCAGFIGCLKKTKIKDFGKKYDRVQGEDEFESEEEHEMEDEVKINKSFFKCNLYYILIFSAFCIYMAITLIDVFLFGYNYYNDGNGMPLKKW